MIPKLEHYSDGGHETDVFKLQLDNSTQEWLEIAVRYKFE